MVSYEEPEGDAILKEEVSAFRVSTEVLRANCMREALACGF